MSPAALGALVLVLLAAATVAGGLAWTRVGARVWTPATVFLLAAAAVVAGGTNGAELDGAAERTLLVAVSGLLALLGGGPVTTGIFTLVDRREPGPAQVDPAGAVLRGGAWIGVLERIGVFATLVAGWPEGVAVVLGLKGLGRYPELRNGEHTGAAERFIIGTFSSVLWAAACSGIARLLI